MGKISFDEISNSKALFNALSKALEEIFEQGEVQSIAFFIIEKEFGLDRTRVLADYPVNMDKVHALGHILDRLRANEPVQYILGETEFFDLTFKVNPTVLIPRPETEELVSLIIRENKHKQNLKIMDIGTGSGCIAISLAKNLPQSDVYALDIDEDTLQTAQTNADLNMVKISTIHGDILKDEILKVFPKPDVIVSNPPYVRQLEKVEMEKNVLEHEPEKALFVPDNQPLLFYERITKLASEKLMSGGKLYFEINEAFGPETKKLLLENGFKDVEVFQDMQGKDRMTKAIK
ncbi:peptide chain release factor N(5)-glutamine methyltransferase [Flexithrix dorotheae]|uniref:peptide chain release factor N(5)-glutamine methyltransferase n=1 Tax=Flexithrix dorotheae TaxID=70993 RepID=UPI00036DD5C3|nr:peptide chain release factor N(5)-glutamine methyltransferase [Flexithrix dorotheae]